MDHSTTGLPSGSASPSSRQDVFLAMILALAAGLGLCVAFAFGYWVRGVIDRHAIPSARAGTASRESGPPAEPPGPTLGTHPVAKPADWAAQGKEPPVAAASPVDPPIAAPRGVEPVARAPERFVLHDPPPQAPTPFILPDKPWFALANLKLDDSATCDHTGTAQVCAVDRSLNTALRWAKSPAEASEKARQAGKLVFLIHVSGNFENPGFT